jgi:hypothetical protein
VRLFRRLSDLGFDLDSNRSPLDNMSTDLLRNAPLVVREAGTNPWPIDVLCFSAAVSPEGLPGEKESPIALVRLAGERRRCVTILRLAVSQRLPRQRRRRLRPMRGRSSFASATR